MKIYEIKCMFRKFHIQTDVRKVVKYRSAGIFSRDNWSLSIGVECDTGLLLDGKKLSDRYDYDIRCLDNGMSYVKLKDTKVEIIVELKLP